MKANVTNYTTNQYKLMSATQLEGVTLVYRSTNRDGDTVESAVNFAGDGYTPTELSEDAVFAVWKNVIKTFWATKIKESELKEDNGGIASKLKSKTPNSIVIRTADLHIGMEWDIDSSVWSRIGLVPTKKDLEACARDIKKKVHRAAVASFNALSFRLQFADLIADDEQTEQTEALAIAM